jgi:hypothetical protein
VPAEIIAAGGESTAPQRGHDLPDLLQYPGGIVAGA